MHLKTRPRAGTRPFTLPLLGRIAAGQPIEAIPGEDEIDLSEFFVNRNRFVLKVQGDSMIEAGILDGDMVIVEKRETADNGEMVVALIDGLEATLKHLQKNRDGSITLQPANPAMTPLRLSLRACGFRAWSSASFVLIGEESDARCTKNYRIHRIVQD